jgi:hypothetical protein
LRSFHHGNEHEAVEDCRIHPCRHNDVGFMVNLNHVSLFEVESAPPAFSFLLLQQFGLSKS